MKFSDSVVTGYTDNFPTIQAKLPLKYISQATSSSPSNSNASPTRLTSNNDNFHLKLANRGSIISLNEIEGNFIDAVSYVLLNDLKTIRFTPLTTQVNSLELKFQQIEILLPHRLPSASCLSVYLESSPEHGDADSAFILVDIIDENYLFTSIKIQLNDFVVNANLGKPFQLDKFNQWGNISVPYSFELRSPPFYIKSLSTNSLIVSLKDGGLLHFKRSSPLSDYEVHNFNEPTSILPFNFIGGIWGKKEDSSKGSSDEIESLGGISLNSMVDIALLTPTIFITLSINKVLKIWDLTTHRHCYPSIDLKENSKDTSFWLTASSTVNYLQVIDNKYLTCHFMTKSAYTGENLQSNSVFKIWELSSTNPSQIDLNERKDLIFKPEFPQSVGKRVNDKNRKNENIWFIQDFFARIQNNGSILYWILWKTNTSSIVSISTISASDGQVESLEWSSKASQKSVLSTFSPYFDSSYYSDKILNSGYYNELIVKTSLDIFRDHIGFKDHDLNITHLSLRQSILETLNEGGDNKLNWYKVDSLCEEYKKLSEECLSLWVNDIDSKVLILNSNSVGVVRPAHAYETFKSNLSPILTDLSIILSTKTYIKVYDQVVQTPHFTSEIAGEIYLKFLAGKIPDEDRDSLIERLSLVPNVIEDFNEIIDPKSTTTDFALDNRNSLTGSLRKLSSIISFKDIQRNHESVLLGLLVLLLLMEINEPILELINKISSKLSTYKLLSTVFDTSYSTSSGGAGSSFSGKVERNQLSNLENSLFWNGVVSNHPKLGRLINKGDFNASYDELYSIISHDYENFITSIIIELINHDEGDLIKEIFIKNLNSEKVIDKFLIGFVYLISNNSTEFYKVFEQEVFDFKDQKVKLELKEIIFQNLTMNENIKTFLDSIFNLLIEDVKLERANYYHSLSILAISQSKTNHNHATFISPIVSTFLASTSEQSLSEPETKLTNSFLNTALKFELQAVEALESVGVSENAYTQQKLLEFNTNLFEMALILNEYSIVYKTLEFLDSHSNDQSVNLTEIFTKLINNLILNRSVHILFSTSNPSQQLIFSNNYLLIDSILLSLANNELALANSLKYYEYLYSWRLFGGRFSLELSSKNLGDKRGAIQALYIFITRFRHEQQHLLENDGDKDKLIEVEEDIKQYKLKVLELYMIILNCLKSFDEKEDQWIIKSSDIETETLGIITLDEIKKEYEQWIMELQNDMREWSS